MLVISIEACMQCAAAFTILDVLPSILKLVDQRFNFFQTLAQIGFVVQLLLILLQLFHAGVY